ncbi:unnamed protein product [Eretmochelys imbricata]
MVEVKRGLGQVPSPGGVSMCPPAGRGRRLPPHSHYPPGTLEMESVMHVPSPALTTRNGPSPAAQPCLCDQAPTHCSDTNDNHSQARQPPLGLGGLTGEGHSRVYWDQATTQHPWATARPPQGQSSAAGAGGPPSPAFLPAGTVPPNTGLRRTTRD